MKNLNYGIDKEVGIKEIIYSVPSWILAVGLLTLPRSLSKAVHSFDGWISLIIAGILAIFLCFITVLLAFSFPKKSFVQYASVLVSRPVAYVLTFFFSLYFLLWAAYETRAVGDIAKQYLFWRTPVSAICLAFLLVVIYAVSGTRIAVFRLNIMFLPFVVGIAFLVLLFSIGKIETEHYMPFFVASKKEILAGVKESVFSFVGFEFLLFYIPFMNHKTGKKIALQIAGIGMGAPVLLYLCFLIVTIGVFGVNVTTEIIYPSIELAKEVEIPGAFFERLESIFFVIWVMAIFNTTVIAYDVGLVALESLFPRMKKAYFIFLLSPIIFFITMFPQNLNMVDQFGLYLSYGGIFFSVVVPTVLFIIAKIKGY